MEKLLKISRQDWEYRHLLRPSVLKLAEEVLPGTGLEKRYQENAADGSALYGFRIAMSASQADKMKSFVDRKAQGVVPRVWRRHDSRGFMYLYMISRDVSHSHAGRMKMALESIGNAVQEKLEQHQGRAKARAV